MVLPWQTDTKSRAERPARTLNGEIAEAAQLLTIVLHCRKQAAQLQTCSGQSCVRARAAFTTCANEHAQSVLQALVKIASAKCPEEVEAFHACQRRMPGSKCEIEDLMALRCASREVLLSSQAS
mmetsp:Transcript_4901/g.14849  ORF Transcript_4901/g.14849 Transcript_4901/m.14849 type:complete len:124 (+) Transcript_4901:223-594(+)|eukprot:scaffold139410_cov32-Tisochrysis_lutea.AAC.1